MNSVSAFIVYLTLFRLAIIMAGVVSIVLGYRLFCRGIWPERDAGKGTTVKARIAGSHFTLKNAAPGTCFALFGVIVISTMLTTGSPKMTLELLNTAVQAERDSEESARTSQLSLELRGDESEGLVAATKKGLYYEGQEDIANAIAAYEKGVAMMATPLNNLAWLYLGQGKTNEALSLSRLAVQLSPDNADFLDTLAEILYKTGNYSEALTFMEKAASLNPKYRQKLAQFREASN